MRKHKIIVEVEDSSEENLKDYLVDVKQHITESLESEFDGLEVMDVKIEDVR